MIWEDLPQLGQMYFNCLNKCTIMVILFVVLSTMAYDVLSSTPIDDKPYKFNSLWVNIIKPPFI